MKKLTLILLSIAIGLLLGRYYSLVSRKILMEYLVAAYLSVRLINNEEGNLIPVKNNSKTLERRLIMKKLTLVLVAVVLGVFLTVPAFAFGPGEGRGPGGCQGNGPGGDHGYYQDRIFKNLNLTDEQKTKIEAMRDANYKATKPLREKMFDKSVELRREWLKANPDKDKITAAQKEMRTLRDSLEDKDTALKLEIRKLLTPEQNEKLANSRWGRGPGFGPRGGMRGHEGHGPGMGMGDCQ